MGKKILVVLLAVVLIAAVVCAFMFKKDLNEKATELSTSLQDHQATTEQLTQAQADLEAANAALAEKETALADAQKALDEAKAASDAALAEKETALAEKETALADAQKALDEAKAALAALEAKTVTAAVANREVTIFHTNDVHSRASANPGMGYAAAAGYINAARAAGENVLVMDAGDTFHGMPFATLVQGSSIAELLNAVGYSVMTPGNHDYNYGVERLVELSKEVSFPIVCCNVVDGEGKPIFDPYVILEAGDLRIGVIGVDNPEIYTSIAPKAIGEATFTDGVAAVTAAVAEIADKTDAIVVLSHWGTEGVDVSSEALATIEGVNLVIDGHSHSTFESGYQVEGGAMIVSSGEYLKNLGMVKLSVDEEGAVEVVASLLPAPGIYADANVAASIDAVNAEQAPILNEVVGNTDVVLEGARELVRAGETNLSNVIGDAMVAFTGADVALTNGGGIRATIDAGEITRGEIINVLPFGNTVVVIEAKGSAIRAAIEHGLRLYPETSGGFPQVGGIRYAFDPSKEVGSRVYEITVNGEPLDDEKLYTLATNDFMATGGDGYAMLAECKVLTQYGGLDEALMAYIASGATLPEVSDGRVATGEAPAPEAEDAAA